MNNIDKDELHGQKWYADSIPIYISNETDYVEIQGEKNR